MTILRKSRRDDDCKIADRLGVIQDKRGIAASGIVTIVLTGSLISSNRRPIQKPAVPLKRVEVVEPRIVEQTGVNQSR
jgi:hypothetical protein